jgi:hypothetical protein
VHKHPRKIHNRFKINPKKYASLSFLKERFFVYCDPNQLKINHYNCTNRISSLRKIAKKWKKKKEKSQLKNLEIGKRR